jgi:hypothetical protein
MKLIDKQMKFFSKHVMFTSIIHATAGIGIGIILARPYDNGHPVQLGILLIAIGIVGHLIPFVLKK